jgi:hypothetical protein
MADRFEHPAPAADQSIDTLVRQLEYLGPGAHLCPIYSRPAERLRMLVPYFRPAS